MARPRSSPSDHAAAADGPTTPGRTLRVACVGEAMLEMSRLDLGAGTAAVGVAGDTYNAAVYLARLLGPGVVSYVTSLGQDRLSAAMIATMAAEGIGTALVGRHPDRLPGLYAIELDATGERSFRYWRESSAARTLFGGEGPTLDDLAGFDLILLSGITLAILPAPVRATLIERLGRLRASGTRVAFDGNLRPRLWPDLATARDALDAMWAATSIALPSLDDEALLRPGVTADGTLARIAALGVPEVALKDGAAGPTIRADGATHRPRLPPAARVVDTSGAGDAFDAGYLAARLRGRTPEEAAGQGHALAGAVIGHHGAILPRAAMPRPVG